MPGSLLQVIFNILVRPVKVIEFTLVTNQSEETIEKNESPESENVVSNKPVRQQRRYKVISAREDEAPVDENRAGQDNEKTVEANVL